MGKIPLVFTKSEAYIRQNTKKSHMLLASPQDYLYQMKAQTRSEAKKRWKDDIKDKWNHVCAYCGENQ